MTVYGDNGVALDLDSAVDAVAAADILVLGFPFCAERLLIDLRQDDHTSPIVDVVEPLASVCAAGRPRCPLCGVPMGPEGHQCVRTNGYHKDLVDDLPGR